ncbi:hypothetical protein PLICRDRAFT_156477 [Plicaturopsis crispa FD-325 SS-3]|nr:hypothetical protein PLICRDRAFT_156477 [Plicaturopsis crispa FD-325 SS-3]
MRSNDRVVFKLHRKNLDTHTEGFVTDGLYPVEGEMVDLVEPSSVLDLLFQYVYPQRQPELRSLDFEVLAALAEAAEKYQIYSAMYVCMLQMTDNIPHYPFEVLEYAVKHGYGDVADQAAYEAMSIKAPPKLSPHTDFLWSRYYARWLRVLVEATSTAACCTIHPNKYGPRCDGWAKCFSIAIAKLGSEIGQAKAFVDSWPTDVWRPGCMECIAAIEAWRRGIKDAVEAIPKFSTFM